MAMSSSVFSTLARRAGHTYPLTLESTDGIQLKAAHSALFADQREEGSRRIEKVQEVLKANKIDALMPWAATTRSR